MSKARDNGGRQVASSRVHSGPAGPVDKPRDFTKRRMPGEIRGTSESLPPVFRDTRVKPRYQETKTELKTTWEISYNTPT